MPSDKNGICQTIERLIKWESLASFFFFCYMKPQDIKACVTKIPVQKRQQLTVLKFYFIHIYFKILKMFMEE